jgi:uncharacterized protein (DUF433 family)
MELDRITTNPRMMSGQPCIRGMRLTVSRTIEITKAYSDRSKLYRDYPYIEAEDIKQALAFAAQYPEILEFHKREDDRIEAFIHHENETK